MPPSARQTKAVDGHSLATTEDRHNLTWSGRGGYTRFGAVLGDESI